MVVYSVYIINKAGSLIYHYDHYIPATESEKTFTFPVDLQLALEDERVVIKCGSRDGIMRGHAVLSVNGRDVSGIRFFPSSSSDAEEEILSYLSRPENFPVNIKFGRPRLRSNECIMLASTFHSLYAISVQLSPVPQSSGIREIEARGFKISCLQTVTGTKFLTLSDPAQDTSLVLKRLHQFYADFALKSPFYTLEMPVRLELFDAKMEVFLKEVNSQLQAAGVVNTSMGYARGIFKS